MYPHCCASHGHVVFPLVEVNQALNAWPMSVLCLYYVCIMSVLCIPCSALTLLNIVTRGELLSDC